MATHRVVLTVAVTIENVDGSPSDTAKRVRNYLDGGGWDELVADPKDTSINIESYREIEE